MLSVLDLFTSEQPVWTAEEMIAKLGYSRPTGYRYVRELCAAGLLARNASKYFLGPRVIELDYQIRQADPLTTSGQEVMKELAGRTGWSATL